MVEFNTTRDEFDEIILENVHVDSLFNRLKAFIAPGLYEQNAKELKP